MFKVFSAYLNNRERMNFEQADAQRKLRQGALGGKKSKDKKKKEKPKRGKFDTGKSHIDNKARRDMTGYLPIIVMWTARSLMFALVYIYHCQASLVHLAWILLSFVLSTKNMLLLSSYAMVPLLSWEFIFIYGVRIPVVQDTHFFKRFGAYFNFTMKAPGYEQSLMFLTLATFCMMISC